MTPKQLIDNAIKPLSSLLKKEGFRKLGRRYYRDDGASRAFIYAQASQWNCGALGASFTIELGVYLPEIERKLGRELAERPKTITDFTWRVRLGHLFPAPNDHWWEIADESSIEEVSDHVVQMVRNYALPWLELGVTNDGLFEILKSSKGIGPASMLWILDHKEEAITCVKRSLYQDNEAKNKIFYEWLEEHKIEP